METGHAFARTGDLPVTTAARPAEAEGFALGYATPGARPRRTPSGASAVAGLAMAALGAAVLLLGMVTLAEYQNQFDSGLEVIFSIAVCIFSAVCLLTALPLIYRGTRGPIQ